MGATSYSTYIIEPLQVQLNLDNDGGLARII